MYSDCGWLPFGIGSTKADNAGTCDVNTISQNNKCVIDDAYSTVTTREQCVVDVWNIFTKDSCFKDRESVANSRFTPRTDMMMNAINHCESHPKVWSAMSNSMTGCISDSDIEKIWHDNNGPDPKSLRGNRTMKMMNRVVDISNTKHY